MAGMDVVIAAVLVQFEEQIRDRFERRGEVGASHFGGALRGTQLGQRRIQRPRSRIDADAQREGPGKQHAPDGGQGQQSPADVAHVWREAERGRQPFVGERVAVRVADGEHPVFDLFKDRQVALAHRPVSLADVKLEGLGEGVLGVLPVKVEICRLLVHAEQFDVVGQRGIDQQFVVRVAADFAHAALFQDVNARVAVLDADLKAAQRVDILDAADRQMAVDHHRQLRVRFREVVARFALRRAVDQIDHVRLAVQHHRLRVDPAGGDQLDLLARL